MLVAATALAILAIALAWPIPIALSRASWPSRSPAIALIAWQAVALGGGLAMLGSLVGFALTGFGPGLIDALGELGDAAFAGPIPSTFGVLQLFALSAAALLALDLMLNLADTAVRTELERRRHQELVRLLGAPDADRPGTRVIDHAAPVAYCLPGVRTVTVLSAGLVEMLTPDELGAVLAHERSHLRQYHHLLLLTFKSWRRALPWFPIATRAEHAVEILVEMLADDRAAHTVPQGVLRSAILRIGGAWGAPDASGGRSRLGAVDAGTIAVRAGRLDGTLAPLPRWAAIGVAVLSALLVALPVVFLLVIL